jgi:hypothetical protein
MPLVCWATIRILAAAQAKGGIAFKSAEVNFVVSAALLDAAIKRACVRSRRSRWVKQL